VQRRRQRVGAKGMLTFLQWQNTRRVDHVTVNLGFKSFHPRVRSRDTHQRPDLKTFDQLVRAYDTPGIKEFAQVTILGEIVGQAARFLTDNRMRAESASPFPNDDQERTARPLCLKNRYACMLRYLRAVLNKINRFETRFPR
jgi:hypothetical protein